MAVISPEIVFWQSIAGSTNPADFEAYLQQFPEGSFVTLARIRLASLSTRSVPSRLARSPELKPSEVKPQKTASAVAAEAKPGGSGATDGATAMSLPKVVASTHVVKPEVTHVQPPTRSPLTMADFARPPQSVVPAPAAPPVQEAAIVRPPSLGVAPSPPPSGVAPRPDEPARQPATVQPYCSIPRFNGMETGAGGYAAIKVANTGQRCGRRLVFGPLREPYTSLSLSTPPSHGSVTLEASAFYYTPAQGFIGRDEFVVQSTPWGHVKAVVDVLPGWPQ